MGEALVAPFAQPVAGREQDHRGDGHIRDDAALANLLPPGQREAGREDDLERAGDPRRVRRMEPMRRLGIELHQRLIGRVDGHRTDRLAHFGIDLGHRRNAIEQRAQI